jgi:hypothetical protein
MMHVQNLPLGHFGKCRMESEDWKPGFPAAGAQPADYESYRVFRTRGAGQDTGSHNG